LLRDLRPIHVTLMAEVEQGRVQLYWRWHGDGSGFHAGIIARMVRPSKQRNAFAVSAWFFAVTVLPCRRLPDLINDDDKLLESSVVVPTECLGDVAATVRAAP
jgi:hypothetical protein